MKICHAAMIVLSLFPSAFMQADDQTDEVRLGTLGIRFPGKRGRYDFNHYFFDRRSEDADGGVSYHLLTGQTLKITREGRIFWDISEQPVYDVIREHFDDTRAGLQPWPHRQFNGFLERRRRGSTIRFVSPFEVPGLYDTQRPGSSRWFRKISEGVRSAAVSPDGGLVVVGGDDVPPVVASWASGQVQATLRADDSPPATIATCFSPDGRRVLTATRGCVSVWDVARGELVDRIESVSPIECVAFGPRGHHVVTGKRDGSIEVWSVSAGRPPVTLNDHSAPVTAMCISSDSRLLVSGDRSGVLGLYEFGASPKLKFQWAGHQSAVTVCAFRPPNDQSFVTASQTGRILLWHRDGDGLAVVGEHRDRVNTLAFSPDGLRLMSGGNGGQLQVFLLRGRRGHLGGVVPVGRPVDSVAFHPDGRSYVVCRRNQAAELRDAVSLESRYGYFVAEPVRDKKYRDQKNGSRPDEAK